MREPERIVIDTNVLVSSLLKFDSLPGQAFARVLHEGVVLVSEATMAELADVLSRSKLDFYTTVKQRTEFLVELGGAADWVEIVQLVRECRDPRDDKFLEAALNGRADIIVTGDADLLVLHPWRGVAILSQKDYLKSAP